MNPVFNSIRTGKVDGSFSSLTKSFLCSVKDEPVNKYKGLHF